MRVFHEEWQVTKFYLVPGFVLFPPGFDLRWFFFSPLFLSVLLLSLSVRRSFRGREEGVHKEGGGRSFVGLATE